MFLNLFLAVPLFDSCYNIVLSHIRMSELFVLFDLMVGNDVQNTACSHCALFKTCRGSFSYTLLHLNLKSKTKSESLSCSKLCRQLFNVATSLTLDQLHRITFSFYHSRFLFRLPFLIFPCTSSSYPSYFLLTQATTIYVILSISVLLQK